MLQTLNTLASKISPNNSPMMPPNLPAAANSGLTSLMRNNANKLPMMNFRGSNLNYAEINAITNNNNNNNNNNNDGDEDNIDKTAGDNISSNGIDEKNENNLAFSCLKRIGSGDGGTFINGSCDKHTTANLDQPDPDYIKMFVGQIPRSMDEDDLKKMFSEYGRVHQVNVLRDKQTGQSKGCCFLTYYTRKAALDAQNALHNIKTLPGMHHPIQMKPADSENRNERKLFVGMLSKKYNEADIRRMFENFGTIEECTVLRDTNGLSKGCAFVTYTSKQCAINAIRTMHQAHTMEGCSSPLVVKFADTQKDKDQKKLQQMHSNIWNMAGINLSPHSYLATAALTQQLANNTDSHSCLTPLQLLQQQLQAQALTNGHSNLNGSLGSLLLHNSQSNDLHGLNALNGSCHNLTTDVNPVNLQGLATLANLSVANTVNPIHVQNLMSLAAITGGNSLSPAALSGLTSPATTGLLNTPAAINGLASAGLNGYASGNLSLSDLNGSMFNMNRELAASVAGKQIEGPEGANLFIYHLPQECTDIDLASMFVPFGNVISAKVFIDKHTNLSKCFGFVSYDNALSAQNAIQNMNCFQVGTKRLKVQLKRPKDASKPY